jgi:protein-S-isoprenylcysteine O-methyltransferase Ste14
MTQAKSKNHPGVYFPPALWFVFGFVSGMMINRLLPLPLIGGQRPAFLPLSAWLLLGAGLALSFSGMLTFWYKQTAIYPNQPASRLVTTGLYRFTRNPMYLGLVVAYLGMVLLTNLLWPLLLLPAVLFVLTTLVIRREERYLADEFGTEYQQYCQRVGRWL